MEDRQNLSTELQVQINKVSRMEDKLRISIKCKKNSWDDISAIVKFLSKNILKHVYTKTKYKRLAKGLLSLHNLHTRIYIYKCPSLLS